MMTLITDYVYFGKWCVPFYDYIMFNNISEFWTESPFFYVFIAIPILMNVLIPISLIGLYQHS